ncbi:MAG: hypothetical protein U0W94_00410 [Buchnera aphidicola (Schlechtendalia peitan)]
MNFCKKILMLIMLLFTFFMCSLIFLVYSHSGLNVICYFVHHYIPELKIKKSIGTLNNFILEDVRYHAYGKDVFIKNLYVKMHVNFLKRLYVCIDKILIKQCNFRIRQFFFKDFTNKKTIINVKLLSIFKIPIFFKNIQLYNFSFVSKNLLLIIDYYYGQYYWSYGKLECLYSKVNNIYIKEYKGLNNSNRQYKNFSINNFNALKSFLKNFLNYFTENITSFPIDIDVKHFYSNRIYFSNRYCFNLSQFFVNFKINNRRINIKKIQFINNYFHVNMFGTICFYRNFYTKVTIHCSNFNSSDKKENINTTVTGFLLKHLDINCNFYGIINTKIYIKFIFEKYNSIFNLKLFIPFFDVVRNYENQFSFKHIVVHISGKLKKYNFFIDSIINTNFFAPMKLYISGTGKYSVISLKKIRCFFTEKEIISRYALNFFNSKIKSTVGKYNKNNDAYYIRTIISNIIHSLFNFKQRSKILLDVRFLYKHSLFKKTNDKLDNRLVKICNKWIYSVIKNMFKKHYNFLKNYSSEGKYINVIFSIDELNNIFSNYYGNIYAHFKIVNLNNNFGISATIIGRNLSTKFFTISNCKASIIFRKSNFNLIITSLSVRELTILDLHISSFFLSFFNHKYSHHLYLRILGKSHYFILLDVNGSLNNCSKIWTETINNINFSTFFFSININKILVIFDYERVLKNFNIYFCINNVLLRRILTNEIKNVINVVKDNSVEIIEKIFIKLKSFYVFDIPFTYKIEFKLNYFSRHGIGTLKWDCDIIKHNKSNKFFTGFIKISKINKKIFFSGKVAYKSIPTCIICFSLLNHKIVLDNVNGIFQFEGNIYNLKIFGNLLIKDLLINNRLYVRKFYVTDIQCITDYKNINFSSCIYIKNFFTIMLKLEFLRLYFFNIKMLKYEMIKIAHIPVYLINILDLF